MNGPRDRYALAMRRVIELTGDAMAEVDAEAPLPRYPLRKRILWRLRGVPAEVRAEQLAVRKIRAQVLLLGLQKRRP